MTMRVARPIWSGSSFTQGRVALGCVFLIAAAVLVVIFPDAFIRGYIFAYLSCLNIALGAMATLLIWHLSGGHWGKQLAPALRAAVGTLPLLALMTLPLWLSLGTIFPWVDVDCKQLGVTAHQCLWLQPELQLLRSALSWVAWLGIAASMAVWSCRQPLNSSSRRAALGTIVFVLVTSMFAVDWFMTLIPRSSSTMIGFLIISEQLVAGLAFATLMTSVSQWRNPRRDEQPDDERLKRNIDLGNLLLSAVMFHGYCLYMDYLIVWEANLPDEIIWYTERSEFFHGHLMWIIVLLYIALPTLLLLFRRIKCSAQGLAFVSTLLLIGHLIVIAWYLAPVLDSSGEPDLWPWNWVMAAVFLSLWGMAVALLHGRSRIDAGLQGRRKNDAGS